MTKGRITRVFLEIQGELRQYLMRFLIRAQDIEDIVQETYLRAVHSDEKQQVNFPKSFMFRIARNLALDEINRRTNRITIHIEDLQDSEVIDEKQSMEEQLTTERRMKLLLNAVSALSPQCRKVFVMGKILGFSHAEISRRLGLSISTIEKHIAKGLRLCQETIRENESVTTAGMGDEDRRFVSAPD